MPLAVVGVLSCLWVSFFQDVSEIVHKRVRDPTTGRVPVLTACDPWGFFQGRIFTGTASNTRGNPAQHQEQLLPGLVGPLAGCPSVSPTSLNFHCQQLESAPFSMRDWRAEEA